MSIDAQESGCSPEDFSPCERCYLRRLDIAQASSLGLLLQRALELEFATEKGITIDAADVGVDAFLALRILAVERAAYEQEQANRKSVDGGNP